MTVRRKIFRRDVISTVERQEGQNSKFEFAIEVTVTQKNVFMSEKAESIQSRGLDNGCHHGMLS